MKWYYEQIGSHVHVRAFMDNRETGELCFTPDMFARIRQQVSVWFKFVEVTDIHGKRKPV